MIDMDTVRFISMLNELVEFSKNGIVRFSQGIAGDKDVLFYDGNSPDENGDFPAIATFVLPRDEDGERDILSYYDTPEYTVRVRFDDPEIDPYIIVRLVESGDEIIVEPNGWFATESSVCIELI